MGFWYFESSFKFSALGIWGAFAKFGHFWATHSAGTESEVYPHPDMCTIKHENHAQCLKLIQKAMEDKDLRPQARLCGTIFRSISGKRMEPSSGRATLCDHGCLLGICFGSVLRVLSY